MKFRFLTFLVFALIFQFQLISQNFEIAEIREHGFGRNGDVFYYKLDVDIKNNTNFKLKRTEFCVSINQLYSLRDCSSKIYDSIWQPQTVNKLVMLISSNDVNEHSFDRTPEDILLSIKIKAHHIDKDFDELVIKYNIIDDWKDFQKVLGLRDIEPKEKLKIIKPPIETENENEIYNPSNPLGLRLENMDLDNQEKDLLEKYYSNSEFKKKYDDYVEKGLYPPFDNLTFERQITHRVNPIFKGNVQGQVVVELIVNRNGIVIQAIAGVKGSTIKDKKLLKSVENAALNTRFESDLNSYTPENQKTRILYNFSSY